MPNLVRQIALDASSKIKTKIIDPPKKDENAKNRPRAYDQVKNGAWVYISLQFVNGRFTINDLRSFLSLSFLILCGHNLCGFVNG